MINTIVWVGCDWPGCTAEIHPPEPTGIESHAERAAACAGWWVSGRLNVAYVHLCPEHAAKRAAVPDPGGSDASA